MESLVGEERKRMVRVRRELEEFGIEKLNRIDG